MTPLHETLESFYGPLATVGEKEWTALLGLGLEEITVSGLLAQWRSGLARVGSSCLMDLQEIIAFDWQEHTLKFGLLTVGYCANGDPIAVDVAAGEPWPVYYISHDYEGLYGDGEPTRIRVSESFERFLIKCDEDEEYPWDYFEAQERLAGRLLS